MHNYYFCVEEVQDSKIVKPENVVIEDEMLK